MYYPVLGWPPTDTLNLAQRHFQARSRPAQPSEPSSRSLESTRRQSRQGVGLQAGEGCLLTCSIFWRRRRQPGPHSLYSVQSRDKPDAERGGWDSLACATSRKGRRKQNPRQATAASQHLLLGLVAIHEPASNGTEKAKPVGGMCGRIGFIKTKKTQRRQDAMRFSYPRSVQKTSGSVMAPSAPVVPSSRFIFGFDVAVLSLLRHRHVTARYPAIRSTGPLDAILNGLPRRTYRTLS